MYVPSTAHTSSAAAPDTASSSPTLPAPDGGRMMAGWLLLSTGPILLAVVNISWLFAGINLPSQVPELLLALAVAALGAMVWGAILTSRSSVGVGGWLIPIALLLVSRILGHAASLTMLANAYVSNVELSKENSMIVWTLLGHGANDATLLILALVTIVLLARRSKRFPRVCSAWLGLSVVLGSLEALWLSYLGRLGYFVDANLLADTESLIVISLVALGSFELYRRRSQRVRETFVR